MDVEVVKGRKEKLKEEMLWLVNKEMEKKKPRFVDFGNKFGMVDDDDI